jgi:hypothetical protein
MVERLAAPAGCGDEHTEVLAQLLLAHELLERTRPQALLDPALVGQGLGRHQAALHWAPP